MEAIYAGLITVLFSAWVWDLKGQVGTTKRCSPAGRAPASPMRAHPAEMTASEASHIVRPNPAHLFKAGRAAPGHAELAGASTGFADANDGGVNRRNGVPVWVIE